MRHQADLFTDTRSGAVFSEDRVYRYLLWRQWGDPSQRALFVLLNPSTADERVNDPTVRRCVGFAGMWGYGAVDVVNVFALRSTDPEALYHHPEPIGPLNDATIVETARAASLVVLAWGAHGAFQGRGDVVRARLAPFKPKCLGFTKGGCPRHPLYIPSHCPLVPVEAAA